MLIIISQHGLLCSVSYALLSRSGPHHSGAIPLNECENVAEIVGTGLALVREVLAIHALSDRGKPSPYDFWQFVALRGISGRLFLARRASRLIEQKDEGPIPRGVTKNPIFERYCHSRGCVNAEKLLIVCSNLRSF